MDMYITLKAYRSNQERESNATPLKTEKAITPEDLDRIEDVYYNESLYVSYVSGAGIRCKRAAARYLLAEQVKEDKLREASFASTSWLEKNRPYLTADLGGAEARATKVGDNYIVVIAVKGPHGYEYFTLKINLQNHTVNLIDEH